MNIEEALTILKTVFKNQGLTNIQKFVFCETWRGKTYVEMADESNYDADYIKFVGFQLWQLLSKEFGEKVNKNNLHSVLQRKAQQITKLAVQVETKGSNVGVQRLETRQLQITPTLIYSQKLITNKCQDWGEAIDVSIFYGRTEETATLGQWFVRDCCRLVALLGIGGIGKTALSVRSTEQIQNEFDYIIWRSLRNAPPIKEILAELIQFLFNQQETNLPETIDSRISLLINYLRGSRCLLVLDNFDTIIQTGEYTGCYREGYEGYGELIRRVGETNHQSCLLLTSREKPKEIALLEGETSAVRSLQLMGLQEAEAKEILKDKGLFGSEEERRKLTDYYRGNPLVLKIAATSIQCLFAGSISKFIEQDTTVFELIRVVLEQQFNRLSALEEQIMYWLAINREPISYLELQEDIIPLVSTQKLLAAVESLRWRSLIEQTPTGFTQQPVIMEYMTERLIEYIYQEITTEKLQLFISYALLKAEAKDYIRASQSRMILEPITDRLRANYKPQQELEQKFKQLLFKLREEFATSVGYGGGNIINLLCQLKFNLSGYDFSFLKVYQAYLQDVNLHQVNFAHTELIKCVFAKTFGGIVSIAFSPDGQILATSDTNGEIQVWKVTNGRQLFICKGHNSWVWFVAFSPNNQILASCSQDHTVKLWDVNTGQCIKTLHGHTSIVTCIAFSPSGNTLASSSEDQTVKLWNINTGECTATLQGHINCVWGVTFSPDGRILASGGEDQTIKLWDVDTGECRQTWQAHSKWVKSVAFSPDGEILASGSFDTSVKLWDVRRGECLKTLQGHTSSVVSLSFSPDGKMLASGSYDFLVKLWDVKEGQCFKTLQGHTNRIWSVAFSPIRPDSSWEGGLIASGGDDHAAKLWNVRTSQCIKTLQGHSNSIYSIALSPDGQFLASGNEDQTVKLWNIKTKTFTTLPSACASSDFAADLRTLQGHSNRVFCVAFSPDSQILASCSGDRTIKLWNPITGQCLNTFYGHNSWVWSVAFSPNGQILASSSYDHTVKLWDVKTGECLKTLQGHTSLVLAITFSPNGELLATGGYEQTIKLWDVKTGECLKTLQGHTSSVLTITFSPNGELLASGGYEQTIKLWDVKTGECLQTLQGHTNRAIAFSPDPPLPPFPRGVGGILASGGDDYNLKLWKVSTGECLKTLSGHTSQILSTLFLDNGTLVSSSADQTIKLWDTLTGECLRTLQGHSNWVWSLALSPNKQILASGCQDETIKFWRVKAEKCLTTLRVPRPYEGMNITGVTGLNQATTATLKALGAVEV